MYSASNPLICGHTSTGFPCRLAKTESSGSLPMTKKMSLPTTVNSSDVLFQLPVEQIGRFPNCTWDAPDVQIGIDHERDLTRNEDLSMLSLSSLFFDRHSLHQVALCVKPLTMFDCDVSKKIRTIDVDNDNCSTAVAL